MLLKGTQMVAYNQDASGSLKAYVSAVEDNTIREFPGTQTCPRFPPFSSDFPRPEFMNLNPFLVILKAEIKFRRCLRQRRPPHLPADVLDIVNLTLELVKMIYWDPVIRPNTCAARIRANCPHPAPRTPSPAPSTDMICVDEEEMPHARQRCDVVRRPAAGATHEERMEYGQYLLSGRNLPFNSEDE
ncbi:hypothetical protein H0H81_004671 [Sphagnurus paluster]|uniref:Uncharacterized protein n=1 Tax=Sphagnurus paluster TaxID=117069 RepID=A0A9P7FW77_9AGAR|nr:hypothetical protein H0H81_004671 [Sphagnurus paluster]